MRCEEVVKRISGLVLEEVDLEVRRDMSAHVEACVACRAELKAQESLLGALRALPDAATSTVRRESAAAAMMAARNELVERAIMRAPARWPSRLGVAAAAAVLLVAVGWVAFQPTPTWEVVKRSGMALHVGVGILEVADRLGAGEQVKVESDAEAVLAHGSAKVLLRAGSAVTLRGKHRLVLNTGSIRVETEEPIVIVNSRGDVVVLERGAAVVTSDRRAVGGSISDDPRRPAVRYEGDWFWVRVERGTAALRGGAGEARLKAGEEGRLDDRGRPLY